MATQEVRPHAPQESFRARVDRFFMTEEAPFGLALSRIMIALVLLFVMAMRWPHAREIYSSDGAPAQLSVLYGRMPMVPELPGSAVVVLCSLLVFFLISSAIGWQTRFSLAATFVLYTYFNLLDAISSMTKYSVIACHILLLLSVSNCGAVWSIDAWLARRKKARDWPGDVAHDVPKSPAWPRRLMQLMIGLVYFGAALTKMHTPGFFSGDQMSYWMVTQVNYANPIGEWMTLAPWVLVVFAYITIVWEVMFVFLAWRGLSRTWMIGLGLLFHLGTAALLGLFIFPAVCFASYFAFMEESEGRRLAAWTRRLRRRFLGVHRRSAAATNVANATTSRRFGFGLTSYAAFTMTVVLVAVTGLAGEHMLDPYDLRRPEGPRELVALDPEESAKYFRPSPRIGESDTINTFDVGTDMLGGVLTDHRRSFRQGEPMIVQVSFAPPHEDMWVECNLHDADGRILDEVGQIVSRDSLRGNWVYLLGDSFDPGEYQLVLKVSGKEVMTKKLDLLPRNGKSVTRTASQSAN